jgi:hypothetical protein
LLPVKTYDDGQPIGAAGHDALITAWRFLAAQLDGQPGDQFQLPGITVTVEDGEVRVSQEAVERLIISLAGIANAQLLANATLVLGEDAGEEAEHAWARGMISEAIAEQTLDAHATDLDS